jgi:hypothetical protein
MSKCPVGPLKAVLGLTLAAFLLFGPLRLAANAADIVYGYVQHVSMQNIKITEIHTNKIQSFALVPSFDQIFSTDGKTTYQMKDLHPGDFVKIYSDHGLFSSRRADKIVVEK